MWIYDVIRNILRFISSNTFLFSALLKFASVGYLMRLDYVFIRGFLQIVIAQLSHEGLSKALEQNDVAADEFGRNQSDETEATDAHTRLLNQIKTASRPFQRPVLNFHSPTEIHVRAALYQILDIDQRNNIATISGYFDLWWIDPSLRWNASEFNNITKTFIPSKWFWKPELFLHHSTGNFQRSVLDYAPDTVAEINANGRLRIFIPMMARALCPINVKHFPFDTQNCTFACGSWSYQCEYISLIVDQREVFLGDFYGSQEWLLENATIHNAVIGFHAPINTAGRHESKFRLGIMTLLSMSVMLLMLVDEMKFPLESVPGQKGSFSGVPLLDNETLYASCYFIKAIPWWLRFLSAKRLFCCYVPKKFRIASSEDIKRNHDVTARFVSSSSDSFTFRDIIPAEINMTECHQETAVSEAVAEAPPSLNTQRIELLVNLMREFIQMKEEAQRRHCLPVYWKRIIKRLENISLTTYLFLITANVAMLICHELWY
uniref:Neurotransmitter-gated ion-channel ligand-binding domain-containing protein n=1 Tax=Setaria digitata TaxID=48799 RepID=A0A915Q5Q9_9BILA